MIGWVLVIGGLVLLSESLMAIEEAQDRYLARVELYPQEWARLSPMAITLLVISILLVVPLVCLLVQTFWSLRRSDE